VYKVAHRRTLAASYVYPKRFYVRCVDLHGQITIRGDSCTVGQAFAHLNVGVEPIDAMTVRVWLCGVDLGLLETLPVVDPSCYEPTTSRHRKRVGIVGSRTTSSAQSSRPPSMGGLADAS
jgi:hypothetical protein